MQHNCSYEDNEIIFCEYEQGDFFYFIKSGKIKLVRIVNGYEVILDILEAGVFFGEMAIIESEPRSATAISYGYTELMRFSGENFEQIILENTGLAIKLLKTLTTHIWIQQKLLHIYKYEDVGSRIITLLKHLREYPQKEANVKVNVTLEEISSWTGVPVSECRKQIQILVASNLIEFNPNHILIKDMSSLERLISAPRD